MAPDHLGSDDPDPGLDEERLAELEERLKKARGRQGDAPVEGAPPSQLGLAFKLVTELLAAVVVGGGVGWALDRTLGTSPVLLIVMFLLGVAAGFRNVIRSARQMNEEASRHGRDGGNKG